MVTAPLRARVFGSKHVENTLHILGGKVQNPPQFFGGDRLIDDHQNCFHGSKKQLRFLGANRLTHASSSHSST